MKKLLERLFIKFTGSRFIAFMIATLLAYKRIIPADVWLWIAIAFIGAKAADHISAVIKEKKK